MENTPIQILKIPPLFDNFLDPLWIELPNKPGTYCYIFELPYSISLRVGKLGWFTFSIGSYAYFGSALGAGGLRSRIHHHLKPCLSPHWHIDWLKPYIQPSSFIYYAGTGRLECRWRSIISSYFQTEYPAPGFGSSDCLEGCPAHLLLLQDALAKDVFTCLANFTTKPIPEK